MKTRLIIYLMSGVVSCQAEKVEPLTLADRVRQSDVIAMAEVREVRVQTLTENFESQAVTCVLTNILKGKPVNNPAEVVLALKLKADPPPDRLLAGKSYLVFIHIETFDHQSKIYQRPRQGQFADAGLVELDKLLHQHHIGGG